MENSLTESEKEVLDALEKSFNDRVLDADKNFQPTYYWKWTSGWELSRNLNSTASSTRAILRRLEQKGYVHCERREPLLYWAVTKIAGFEQHRFKDYYCRH